MYVCMHACMHVCTYVHTSSLTYLQESAEKEIKQQEEKAGQLETDLHKRAEEKKVGR